ncbi:MAG TPA: isopeptide-forming domain-containing fimbrial protein, partial [Wenzhouxiangella sp.]|nr:isopeptide-forming domain-containing fimbrial protein [Wenzhouxiangella sp.]
MNKIAVFVTGVLAFVCAQFAVAQTPVASPTVPAESFLGEQFCFDVDFNNSGAPGYGPYLRLELAEGLTLDSADIFGGGSLSYVGDFPASPGNQLTDPVIDQPVTGTPGAALYVLEYPVGSVVDGGPDLPAELCATIDPDAILGDPLDIIIIPVYEFGDTPTGDNGPIIGSPINDPVTPTVMRFTKTDTAPESERTPGPSWPYSYNLTVDIANQAIINPLVISDELPADFQFAGNLTVTGGAGCTATVSPPTSTPGGSLEVTCSGNTVGTAAADDVVVSYEGHIVDILDEMVCTTAPVINDAAASGTYQPTSGPAIVLPPANDQTTVTARHLAVQKSVSPAAAMPGQSLSYTLNFQVTDFGDADSLVVTDLLPDGIDFTSHASLSVDGNPVTITPTVTVNPDSTTTIVYDIGAAAGTLVAGTAVTLNYDAQVRNNYQGSGSPVLASDSLTNQVDADYSLVQGASDCSDDSAATVVIAPVAVNKEIVNPQPEYLPGED